MRSLNLEKHGFKLFGKNWLPIRMSTLGALPYFNNIVRIPVNKIIPHGCRE